MSSVSAVPVFFDKLVEVFNAALAVEVYDGPPITSAHKQGYVAVGWDGADPTGGDAADIEQPWSTYIGSQSKDEAASVNCVAVSWSGGTDWKAERDLAFGYLSACEQALRAAVRTDAVLMTFIDFHISAASLVYDNSDGVAARVPFTVSYKKRI